MNETELNPSLWLYVIHSKNAELIHLLESNKVPPPISKSKKEEEEKGKVKEKEEKEEEDRNEVKNSSKNYEQCLIESIKCHHNDIAEFSENNFIDLQQNEKIISNYIKYHNYSHFEIASIIDHCFFYLHFYHYDKLLLKKKKESIEEKKIQYSNV